MSNPAEQFNMQTPDWSSLEYLSDTSLDCLMDAPCLNQPMNGPLLPLGGGILAEAWIDSIFLDNFDTVNFTPLPSPSSTASLDFFTRAIEDPFENEPQVVSVEPSLTPIPLELLDSEQTQVTIDEDLQVTFRCPGCQFWHDKYSRVLKTLADLVCVELNPGPPKQKKQKMTKKTPSRVGRLTQINNPTQARAQPGRLPAPRSLSMGIQHLVAYMKCLNDPFNEPPARPGVGCALPTGLMTCYYRTSIATASTGQISLVFNPSRMQAPIMSSISAGSPYTYVLNGPSAFPQYAAIFQLYEKVRLLASGVRIIPMQSSLTDGGQISTALIPAPNLNDITNFGQVSTTGATYGYNEYPNFPQTLQSPFKVGATVLWRPQDPNSYVFRQAPLQDTITSIADSLQNQPFMIAGLSGCSGSSTGSTPASFIVEFIAHYEGTVAGGNAGVLDLQRAPPTSDLQALKAVDSVFGTDTRTTFPGYLDTFISASAKAGRNFGRQGKGGGTLLSSLGEFGSSLAGPLASSLMSLF
jgi:hypothetical protein